MAGCTPLTYKFQRSMQAEQIPAKMDSQSSKSKSEDIYLDFLFQRILSVCSDEEQMSEDQTHERRNPIQSLRIDISGEMTVDCNKKLFLSNSENKQQFVSMLGNSHSLAGYNVTMHDNDADVMIVEQTLNLLKNNNVRVIADDTDVFVLLLSKVSKVAQNGIYPKQPKAERLINISSIVGLIQVEKLKKILFLHVMSGCDTTSFLLGVGKTKLYKKEILEKHEDLSDVFYN